MPRRLPTAFLEAPRGSNQKHLAVGYYQAAQR